MTDDREVAELVVELTEFDPFGRGGGGCMFCGSFNRDSHRPHCLWRRAAAWRWRSSTAIRGTW
jgi:hypothetical protein